MKFVMIMAVLLHIGLANNKPSIFKEIKTNLISLKDTLSRNNIEVSNFVSCIACYKYNKKEGNLLLLKDMSGLTRLID